MSHATGYCAIRVLPAPVSCHRKWAVASASGKKVDWEVEKGEKGGVSEGRIGIFSVKDRQSQLGEGYGLLKSRILKHESLVKVEL
jgi:hypothetical protein